MTNTYTSNIYLPESFRKTLGLLGELNVNSSPKTQVKLIESYKKEFVTTGEVQYYNELVTAVKLLHTCCSVPVKEFDSNELNSAVYDMSLKLKDTLTTFILLTNAGALNLTVLHTAGFHVFDPAVKPTLPVREWAVLYNQKRFLSKEALDALQLIEGRTS